MTDLINSIVSRDFVKADSIIMETVELIMAKKLEEAKKMCAAKMSVEATAAELTRKDVVEEENIEESDLPITTKKEKMWIHTHKENGREKHMNTPTPTSDEWEVKELKEENLDEARVKIIKARIRGGKIQRRKKVSNVPGMTLRGGKLQRMSTAERRRRKMGAKRAVRKRATKMNRSLMKRKRSLMKRRALGI